MTHFGWREMEALLNNGLLSPMQVDILGKFRRLELSSFFHRRVAEFKPTFWMLLFRRRALVIRAKELQDKHALLSRMSGERRSVEGNEVLIDAYLVAAGAAATYFEKQETETTWLVSEGLGRLSVRKNGAEATTIELSADSHTLEAGVEISVLPSHESSLLLRIHHSTTPGIRKSTGFRSEVFRLPN